MDWHEYVTGQLIEERLAEYRRTAARLRLSQEQPRTPLRIVVGGALIRLGSWIEGEAAPGLSTSYRRA
jgi:hypothetical protein